MELWILFIILAISFILGIIPIVGMGWTFFTTFLLSEWFAWTEVELIVVLLFIVIGSLVGVIIGVNGGFLSAGLLWAWAAGCFFLNFTFSGFFLLSSTWNWITAAGLMTIASTLGIAGFRRKSKKMDRRCLTLLGRKICIGLDED